MLRSNPSAAAAPPALPPQPHSTPTRTRALQPTGRPYPCGEGQASHPAPFQTGRYPELIDGVETFHLVLACAVQVYSGGNNMRCFRCRIVMRFGRSPPHPAPSPPRLRGVFAPCPCRERRLAALGHKRSLPGAPAALWRMGGVSGIHRKKSCSLGFDLFLLKKQKKNQSKGVSGSFAAMRKESPEFQSAFVNIESRQRQQRTGTSPLRVPAAAGREGGAERLCTSPAQCQGSGTTRLES